VPVPQHSYCKKLPSYIQSKSPLFYETISPCPILTDPAKETVLSLQLTFRYWQAALSSPCSPPFSMLHSPSSLCLSCRRGVSFWDHFRGPPLDMLWKLHVSPVLKAPCLDAVLQVRPHSAEQRGRITSLTPPVRQDLPLGKLCWLSHITSLLWFNLAGGWALHSQLPSPHLPSGMRRRIGKKHKVQLTDWDKTIYWGNEKDNDYDIWNIPLASLSQLSSLCSLPAPWALCWEQPWLCTTLLSSSCKHRCVISVVFLLAPKQSTIPGTLKKTTPFHWIKGWYTTQEELAEESADTKFPLTSVRTEVEASVQQDTCWTRHCITHFLSSSFFTEIVPPVSICTFRKYSVRCYP